MYGWCAPPVAQAEKTYAVGSVEGALRNPTRGDREVGYKVYYPRSYGKAAHVVLMSHGGNGADNGEKGAFAALGAQLAGDGYVAIAVGHRKSASIRAHEVDRPADVSFLIDSLSSGALAMPQDFGGTLILDRVGHVGHSWGAYTANAVGGGTFDQGRWRDPRVAAVVPISPQGQDQFGSFDRGPADNTWRTVEVPTYLLVGGAEMRGAPSRFDEDGWRARGFSHYPADGNRFLSVLPGQNHGNMGGGGAPEVVAFINANVELFLDIYVRGATTDPCRIGSAAYFAGTTTSRKASSGIVANETTCRK